MRLGLGIGIGGRMVGNRWPVLASPPPSLFWPINTAQSYNIAQHVTGPVPITYTTSDTLPTGVTLSSAGTLSGTPTIVTGFIGVGDGPEWINAGHPVYRNSDVPAAFTVGMGRCPVENGVRVDISSYPSDNSSAITHPVSQERGTATTLLTNRIIADTVAFDIEIRAVMRLLRMVDLKTARRLCMSDFRHGARATPTVTTSTTPTWTVTAYGRARLAICDDPLVLTQPDRIDPDRLTKERDIQAAGGTPGINSACSPALLMEQRRTARHLRSAPLFGLPANRGAATAPCPMSSRPRHSTSTRQPIPLTLRIAISSAWDADVIAMKWPQRHRTAICRVRADWIYLRRHYCFDRNQFASVRAHAAQRNIYASSEDPGAFSRPLMTRSHYCRGKSPLRLCPRLERRLPIRRLPEHGRRALTVSSHSRHRAVQLFDSGVCWHQRRSGGLHIQPPGRDASPLPQPTGWFAVRSVCDRECKALPSRRSLAYSVTETFAGDRSS